MDCDMNEEKIKIRQEAHRSLKGFRKKREKFIPILQGVQGRLGYLPKQAMSEIANFINIPVVDV